MAFLTTILLYTSESDVEVCVFQCLKCCEQVRNLLLLWIATVTIEDFAKPSESDHVNDVHLISREPQYKIMQ